MICAICQSPAVPHCTEVVLNKYNIQYYQCSSCQFIFTESPYWLNEAYESAIAGLDIGLIMRNESMAGVVQSVITTWLDQKAKFIDYGGGYGMLVRMMRDRGFDFYRQDSYCSNLFASTFDITDVPPFRAELVTAFEVFEHMTDPIAGLESMLELSDTILFSTAVQPNPSVTPATWWYFSPFAGQHIAIFSRASLYALANRFGLNYCWNDRDVHLFTRKPISNTLFRWITHPRLNGIINKVRKHPASLLQTDFNRLAEQMSNQAKQ